MPMPNPMPVLAVAVLLVCAQRLEQLGHGLPRDDDSGHSGGPFGQRHLDPGEAVPVGRDQPERLRIEQVERFGLDVGAPADADAVGLSGRAAGPAFGWHGRIQGHPPMSPPDRGW